MEFPQVFTFRDGDEAAAATELGRALRSLSIGAPVVLAGEHGKALASGIEGTVELRDPDDRADQEWAAGLGSMAHRAGADAIVAIGGGRTLDVGKLAAARAGIAIVSVPTQPSHDGICSPVAVVPDDEGRAESVGAVVPLAVFVSIPTLLDAPEASVRAGIGDLLANPYALRDWGLAAERGLEVTDDRAWDLSSQAYELIQGIVEETNLGSRLEVVPRLVEALVLSGMAMIWAHSSRPASGGEHEISHAMDELLGGRALHGEQVAFGCLFSAALYDDDVPTLRSRLHAMGLPADPGDLGLDEDEVVRILLHAPETRPGRFTILEHADLDDASARALVKQVFGDA